MADPFAQPFDEDDVIVGVTVVREDLQLSSSSLASIRWTRSSRGAAGPAPPTRDGPHRRDRGRLTSGGVATEEARLGAVLSRASSGLSPGLRGKRVEVALDDYPGVRWKLNSPFPIEWTLG